MSLQQMQLELAGQKAKARARAGRNPRLSSSSADGVQDSTPRDPLDGVLFASPRAREVAEEGCLTWRHFSRSVRIASSDNGYTTSDVRAIANDRED